MSGHEHDDCDCTYVEPMLLVGREAFDFQAPAHHKGRFTEISLSDYRGKWVVLLFYPADFTFV